MFICRKCQRERDDKLKAKRPGLCRVCDTHRPKDGPFDQFEAEYMERLAQKEFGIKPCPCCAKIIVATEAKGGYCVECYSLKKSRERRRAAERAGKVYVPGREARLSFDNAQRMTAHVAEYRKAKAKQERRAALIAAKPWRAPGLTGAEAFRIRYRHDPEFQIKERLRRQLNKKRKRDDVADMVRAALKRNGNSPTAERMLGYSLADLKAHIERQFTNGMTWARFLSGEIHIDHIIPQASFDLSIPDEWKRCWCLSNLRPLWAKDNWQKSARIECLI